MNEHRPELAKEIASLQTRADQLRTTGSGCRLRLASLAIAAEAARTAEDALAAHRVGRQIQLEEQRALRIRGEMETLLELIAARRARYRL